MPDLDDDGLLLRHLAGALDDVQAAALVARLGGDAALRRRLRDLALLDSELPRALAAPRRARRWPVALAAAAVLAVAATAGLWWHGGATRPAMSGAERDGDAWVAGTGAGATLTCGRPGVRATLAEGGRLRLLGDGPDLTVALDQGTLRSEVAALAGAEAYRVRTPHGEVAVRGTVFTVDVAAAATRVLVTEGRVAARRGDEAIVAAGEEALLAPGLPLMPLPLARRRLPLEPARGQAWIALGDPACRPDVRTVATPLGEGVELVFSEGAGSAVPWVAASLHWDGRAADLSGTTALRFWFRGRGDGRAITCELSGPPPGGDLARSERFVQPFRDDHAGWRPVRLALVGFRRRTDWQPDDAPARGLDPAAIHAVSLLLAPGRDGALAWAAVEAVEDGR